MIQLFRYSVVRATLTCSPYSRRSVKVMLRTHEHNTATEARLDAITEHTRKFRGHVLTSQKYLHELIVS